MPMHSEDEVLNRVRSLLVLKAATSKSRQFGPPSKHISNVAAKWKDLFNMYDRDGSGSLSFEDLKSLVRQSLHLSTKTCPDMELRLLFERIDTDGSKMIEFDEFYEFLRNRDGDTAVKQSAKAFSNVQRALRLALKRRRLRTEEQLRELFEENIDLNSEGCCSPYILITFMRDELKLTKHEATDRDLKQCFRQLDKNGNGSMEVDEFVDFALAAMRQKFDLGGSASAPTLPAIASEESGSKSKQAAARNSMVISEKTHAADNGAKGGKLSSGSQLPQSLAQSRRNRDTYLIIQGAERLSRIEQSLFNSGLDVRGHYFHQRTNRGLASTVGAPFLQDRSSSLKNFSSKDLKRVCYG